VPEGVIVDASAMVDLLVGTSRARFVADRLRGRELHAPSHFDAEVLSAIGRIHRAGHLSARQGKARLERLASAPIERHLLADLVADAWARRHELRLVDGLYAALADSLGFPIVTTDTGFAAAAPAAELIRGEPEI